MEPRPQRPSRATGPYISTGTPSPSSGSSGSSSGSGNFGTPPFDASGAPPAPPPAIGYDPDYSPGQPLTPLRGPRAANILGPLLAVAALAIIIAAAAFIVSQFRGGDDNNDPQPTTIAGAVGSPTTESGDEGDGNPSGAETPAGEDAQSTDESGGDDTDTGPTSTPRINRTPNDSTDDGNPAGDEPTAESGESEPRTRARQWFPSEGDVGEGYTRTDNGTRDAAGVAASFPDPEDAAVKLEEFGWAENAYREFSLSDGGDNDTIVVNVSIHRFSSEGNASNALVYFAEGGQTGSGLATVDDAPELGEESVTLQGATEGGNIYVIYVREGRFVFRIGGFSPTGDPRETTTGVTERILQK